MLPAKGRTNSRSKSIRYSYSGMMEEAVESNCILYIMRPSIRCMRAKDRIVKSSIPFGTRKPEVVAPVVEECLKRGLKPPGSWGSIFSELYKVPRPLCSATCGFSRVEGGYIEALETGKILGPLYEYDIQSAYAWAAYQGLPDPKTYRPGQASAPGSMFVAVDEKERFRVISTEEIEQDGGRLGDIRWAVSWDKVLDLRPSLERIIETWPRWCWKPILRSFWGSWISTRKVCIQHLKAREVVKEWELPPRCYNPIWAHLIVSRVKRRVLQALAEYAGVHACVDSVIVRREMPTGDKIGDWRLKAVYTHGLVIEKTNVIRSHTGEYVKHAGISTALAN